MAKVEKKNGEKVLLHEFKKKEDYVDKFRNEKDILTEFVNAYFLPREFLGEFITLVNKRFSTELGKFRKQYKLKPYQCFFTFKGGNVLHLMNLNRKNIFPGVVNKVLDVYDNWLRQSDNDFSIYLDTTIDNYEQIFQELSITALILLKSLRKYYNTRKTTYFQYFSITLKRKRELLRNLAKALDAKSVTLGSQPDKIITDISRGYIGEYIYTGGEKLGKEHIFYSTLNTTLKFKHGDYLSRFNLARTKVAFTVKYEKDGVESIVDLGGELIDVSIPHRTDSSLSSISDWEDFYKSNFKIGPSGVRMINMKYIIKDLIKVLFVQTDNKPWLDRKYDKRMARLMYFILLHMLHSKKVTPARVEKLIKMFNGEMNFDDTLIQYIFDFMYDIALNAKTTDEKRFAEIVGLNIDQIGKAIEAIKGYFTGYNVPARQLRSFRAFSPPE